MKQIFAKPKKASTVIILRECDSPECRFEVLMMKRHPGNSFVPGSYVFPGGGMDESDMEMRVHELCRGVDRDMAADIITDIDTPETALACWVTAIRETFEESGILFACSGGDSLIALDPVDEKERFNRYRDMLNNKSISFIDIMQAENLMLAAEKLHYYSHWITPFPSPIRYDTRFFIALAPENQEVCIDSRELVEYTWITPEHALGKNRAGNFKMVYPTAVTLRSLASYTSVEQVLNHCCRVQAG